MVRVGRNPATWAQVRWKMVAITTFTGGFCHPDCPFIGRHSDGRASGQRRQCCREQIQMLVEASRSVASAILDHTGACVTPPNTTGLMSLLAYTDEAFPPVSDVSERGPRQQGAGLAERCGPLLWTIDTRPLWGEYEAPTGVSTYVKAGQRPSGRLARNKFDDATAVVMEVGGNRWHPGVSTDAPATRDIQLPLPTVRHLCS